MPLARRGGPGGTRYIRPELGTSQSRKRTTFGNPPERIDKTLDAEHQRLMNLLPLLARPLQQAHGNRIYVSTNFTKEIFESRKHVNCFSL